MIHKEHKTPEEHALCPASCSREMTTVLGDLQKFLLTNDLPVLIQAGDWECWIRFLLKSIVEVGTEAVETTRKIPALLDEHVALPAERMAGRRP